MESQSDCIINKVSYRWKFERLATHGLIQQYQKQKLNLPNNKDEIEIYETLLPKSFPSLAPKIGTDYMKLIPLIDSYQLPFIPTS